MKKRFKTQKPRFKITSGAIQQVDLITSQFPIYVIPVNRAGKRINVKVAKDLGFIEVPK